MASNTKGSSATGSTSHASGAIGAVLVGGTSTRFGSDKASAMFGRRTLLQHQLATLAAAGCAKRVYVGGEPRPEIVNARHVVDRFPTQGPLGGIISALTAVREPSHTPQANDVVVVLAVDVPMVAPRTIERLISAIDNHDVSVALAEREHWSCLAVRTALLDTLQAEFDKGERAIYRATTTLRVARVACNADELVNINDRATLKEVTAAHNEHR